MKSKLLAGVLALGLAAPLAFADDEKIKVLSRNVYLGADIFPVLAAAQDPDPLAVPLAVTEVFQTAQATNFPERAGALADEIVSRKPHVIGLQEVSIWSTQIPGDFLIGNPAQASDVVYDFLEILMANLEARGLSYEVAASVDNADIELPFVAGITAEGPILGDVRLQDRDIVLVRKKVSYSNALSGNFTVNGVVDINGVQASFTRGYNILDVNVKGADYRIVNTHLEVGGSEPFKSLQAVQMNELLQIVDATSSDTNPIIMLGDFNSDPRDTPFVSASGIPGLDGLPLVPPYLQATGTGYGDTWLMQDKIRGEGLTCCFDDAVSDETATLSSRIDHVFLKLNGSELERVKVKVLGDSSADMTDTSNLYPSDHAGVFAKIRFDD
ncbi:hypothetical protein A3762_10480 [Oleiphilus sp. HI0125]|uniref:endonuclease/exonuclease/phosphatase family protein n=2 Tax=Oleiphilus sp. HI0125 TaxID=1822266 RepID=UPI0007C288C0|nr:endonuclease/exonuclease/phosphatase family protein [Oleiphilus sp. HI0125]KZZ57134.1 hypothetical protein A3762_10480 [Oleiphilus sp. HI0125]